MRQQRLVRHYASLDQHSAITDNVGMLGLPARNSKVNLQKTDQINEINVLNDIDDLQLRQN